MREVIDTHVKLVVLCRSRFWRAVDARAQHQSTAHAEQHASIFTVRHTSPGHRTTEGNSEHPPPLPPLESILDYDRVTDGTLEQALRP